MWGRGLVMCVFVLSRRGKVSYRVVFFSVVKVR